MNLHNLIGLRLNQAIKMLEPEFMVKIVKTAPPRPKGVPGCERVLAVRDGEEGSKSEGNRSAGDRRGREVGSSESKTVILVTGHEYNT